MIDRAIDQAAAAFVNAGRARLTSGDSNAAAGLFLRTQLLAPGKLAAVVNHALCYQQQPKALRFFRWASILSPGHPAVLANIGAWFARTSDCSRTLQAYRRLALAAPADARANNGLAKVWLVGVDQNGQVYGDQKRIDDCLRRTGVLTPDDLQARILRAQILMRTNAASDARAIIEPLVFETDMQTQAMVLERLEPNFLVLLAEELWQHKQQTRALDCIDLVLQHHPHNLVAVKVKARFLRLQGDYKLSRDLFQSVLVRDPQDRVGVLGLKESLVKLKALSSVDRYFRHLNALKPSNFLNLIDDWSVASFHAGKLQFSKKLVIRSTIASPGTLLRYQNFTSTLIAEQQLRLADRIVKYAECFGPSSSTCVLKGLISLRRDALLDAAREFAKAIDIEPENTNARFNRSLMRLKSGEVAAGLAEYDLRWQRSAPQRRYEMHPTPDLDIPVWQGSDLRGQRIHVLGEQGIGDEIWFSGMLPALVSAGALVTFGCNPKLLPLMQRSFPSIKFYGLEEAPMPQVENFDFQIPVGSILRFIYHDNYKIPTSYLTPDPDLVADRRRLYSNNGQNKVIGLSWRSLKVKQYGSFEAALGAWSAIKDLQNCTFISLQYGDTERELADFTEQTGIHIVQDKSIHTFDDVDGVAAQIKAVDGVISIASSTIMLAHATGTPAWAALRSFQDDWRFQDHCRESIWLPNCRQFWPSGSTNWQTSISQITADLNDYFSGR